ncbi:MAG TPA: S9 family peptidase [Acidimicrobiia bacterium]
MTPAISALAVGRTRTVAEPRWSPDGSRWGAIEAFAGRADVVVGPADAAGPALVVTPEVEVTGVGAYGGGAWCWGSASEVVYAAADGRLVVVAADGGSPRVLSRTGRASAPSAWGGRVAFSRDVGDACHIAEVALDGSSWPARLSSGGDFAWDPDASGAGVAWVEWDLPSMPFDESRILLAARRADGVVRGDDARVVAGGGPVSVGQPRFSPDGARLAYVSDASGWWNVWVADADGAHAHPVLDEPHDHAAPTWSPGQRSFAWAPDGSAIAICRNEDGFGRLIVVPVSGRRAASARDVREVAKGWHHSLDWGPGGIVATRSGARTPPTITVVDPDSTDRRVLARGAPAGIERDAVEPEAVTWTSGTETVHGLLYRPSASALGADTAPPMLVLVHGGPSDQATVVWQPRVAYFVDRGWAVLRPDHRGSTGYGRPYVQALRERWGELDVEDTAAGIRAAADRGWCDPDRVAVMGGSAGGLTTLLLCAQHGTLVKAGVSLFGVTNLFDLAETTHRLESRYVDWLVGPLPEAADRYRDHSPVTHAASIKVPLLLLQGDADNVVPPAQAQLVVDAVRATGGTVDHHVYAGEGHGWGRPETMTDELERVEAFVTRWVLRR